MSALNDDFMQSSPQCDRLIWNLSTFLSTFLCKFSFGSRVCMCQVNTSFWFINQVWMLRVGTEVTMICRLQNILKAKSKFRFEFLSRCSNLNLGWYEFLFFTAWCFYWFVNKINSLPGPLSSSWLKTHLDCFYQTAAELCSSVLMQCSLQWFTAACRLRGNDSE